MANGGFQCNDSTINVDISTQTLQFRDQSGVRHYRISTALNGPGQLKGSECTPLGAHYIRAKVGSGCLPGSVFVARRFTGEIYSEALALAHPSRDWILSRIMWLSGLEIGKNRLGNVDSMQRYIYIHGTPDSEPMGTPLSHGCIRMRNTDVIELYDKVNIGTRVYIK